MFKSAMICAEMPILNRLGIVIAHASADGWEAVGITVTAGLTGVGEIAGTAVKLGLLVHVAMALVVVGATVIVV